MENVAVHRIVEQHAASRGDRPAVVCGADVTTYRDLNFRANAVARHLIDAGFCRGGHALIDVAPGVELVVVLMAVLKAGGAYTWVTGRDAQRGPGEVGRAAQRGPGEVGRDPRRGPGAEFCSSHRRIELTSVLAQPLRPGPNLPILTRPTDPACVLVADGGAPSIVVPHATITALRDRVMTGRLHAWDSDPTTFQLWIALMAGATLTVDKTAVLMRAA
jgi:hypothetical protein